MRAIEIRSFGGPERPIEFRSEVPAAEAPEPGEVLIRVTRAGVNFADTHTRTNSYVQRATLPLVLGGEVAGVVERAPAGAGTREASGSSRRASGWSR